ncbi:hypothetical protein SNE40_018060 [Patella caerulea]|uniref:Ankyrin and armadillo repeat-containing protein n=1 Tax=Patella caerulea TaxID=87958 RepID=A0AAN8PBL8_PATCE
MMSTGEQQNSDEAQQISLMARNAISFFERYDNYECQELLEYSTRHWMLSTDDFKFPTDPPVGLISNVNPTNSNKSILLLPVDETVTPLDYREVHQIIRELINGIYVLNQTPTLSLEANFDQSTSCQLAPAYIDTKIGQTMVSVDYMMKGMWHGAYIPKDKRTKFSERWRMNLDVDSHGKPETKKSLLNEFTSAGLIDITADPDYTNIYNRIPMDLPGDSEMMEERRFFMSHAEDLSMKITLLQKQLKHHKDMYLVDSDWLVSSIVRLLDNRIDHTGYERIKTRLQMHEEIIKSYLPNKAEVRRNIELLKLVSFLTPFLMGMRKKMKIPDITRLLPPVAADECRTERELPPLILGSDFRCHNFSYGERYFNLHGGIVIDLETDEMKKLSQPFIDSYEDLHSESQNFLNKMLDPVIQVPEQYKVPIREIDGKNYYVIMLEFETYYSANPQKPLWIRAFHEELQTLKPKKLPIHEIPLHEQFKKYFGYKKALKYKTPQNGLKAAAQRGLVVIFHALCRKMPASRLGKQDEHGLSYLHYAAMFNRPQIIALLLLQSMDVNVRRNNIMGTGPTGLHMAARCGSLDAVACLLANYANVLAIDQDGWAPIHHAAFFNHQDILALMIRKNSGLMELQTKNDLKSSPLLLAASSGALMAVRCLIELGADISKVDTSENNMVNLAALRFHTNILEYLIEWNNPDIPVWKILVGMLRDESLVKQDAGVKCLEVLSTSKSHHWKAILHADGIPALVDLLNTDNDEIQTVAASVLCNISEHHDIRFALTRCLAGPILIKLLGSSIDDIQSRAAIILSDLASVEGNQDNIASNGGIPPLVHLLDSELEDVLVNTVNAIRVMCLNNAENQAEVAKCGGIEPLVEFLTVDSDILQAATSAAIAAVCAYNKTNQDSVMAEGAIKHIVDRIRLSRNVTVQVKAASALEALADNNPEIQKAFLELDAPKALIKLLKNINVEVREQGACSLWALAGHKNTQQKYIAERTGIQHIIQMLLEPTEKLLYVGCMTAIALGRENAENQNKLASADAFQQLIRLLRSNKTSARVLLMVIKVLGILCVGVAYRNNKVTQRKIAEEGGIPILVQLLKYPLNQEIQVEVAISLACVVLSNHGNQEKLQEEPDFNFDVLLYLLRSKDEDIQLKAGTALTIFAFNNTPQQFEIREAGGIKYSMFERFIDSPDEFYQCYAAFQVVVLARVIVDVDQVVLTARGITLLVEKLKSKDNNVTVLAASLLSSLAHTRAGIPDAMITTGAIDLLIEHLYSSNDQVKNSVAVALGYLTYNKTAARLLFSACRNTPGLYNLLVDNIGSNPRISEDFVSDFRRAKIVGLPSQCVEMNGGKSRCSDSRPQTSHTGSRVYSRLSNRAVSAPAVGHRSKKSVSPTSGGKSTTNLKTPERELRPHSGSTRAPTRQTTNSSFKTNLNAWKK